jgi:hypothetical protein
MYSVKNWLYVASIAGLVAFAVFLLLRMEGVGTQFGMS